MTTGLLRCLLILVLASPASAQVFRWVDEKGVTHYGPRPPQGRKAQEVGNRLASPVAPAPNSQAPPDWKSQEQDFQERRFRAEQAQAKQQAQDEKLRRACNEARDDLAQARNARRIYRLNEKGERVYQSDEERAASIARREQEIAARCR